MTRKHFQELANQLRQVKPQPGPDEVDKLTQWRRDVEAIADACNQLNNSFNRDRFLGACDYND